MGVLLKWKKPDREVNYDKVRIYRGLTETGTFTYIATQNIEDSTYYDIDGTVTSWYKVDFYNTILSKASSLSDAMQAGKWRGYCSVDDVKTGTSLGSNLTDTQIANLIEFASSIVNSDVQIYHEDERIEYIQVDKDNEINGTNTTFYTKYYPLGDSNDDFIVGTSDVTVYSVDSDGNRVSASVSSVNQSNGQFVLSTAPTTDKTWYVTYYSAPRRLSMYPPHSLIKQLAILQCAVWGHSKLNYGKATRFRTAALTVFRDMDSPKNYRSQYIELLSKVNAIENDQAQDTENRM